jgi:hypothetical protein
MTASLKDCPSLTTASGKAFAAIEELKKEFPDLNILNLEKVSYKELADHQNDVWGKTIASIKEKVRKFMQTSFCQFQLLNNRF